MASRDIAVDRLPEAGSSLDGERAVIPGHRDAGSHGLILPAGDALFAWVAERIA